MDFPLLVLGSTPHSKANDYIKGNRNHIKVRCLGAYAVPFTLYMTSRSTAPRAMDFIRAFPFRSLCKARAGAGRDEGRELSTVMLAAQKCEAPLLSRRCLGPSHCSGCQAPPTSPAGL